MNILIYGSGRLGKQLFSFIKSHFPDSYTMLGFVDDTKPAGEPVIGPYLTTGSLKENIGSDMYSPDKVKLVFAIGYADMEKRLGAFNNAKELGYECVTLTHPRAVVEPDVQIGPGTILSAGAVIDRGSRIGEANFIDVGVVIGEENQIANGNFICAGTVTGGFVKVGSGNFIGLNSTVVNDVEIGDFNFINAMTLVHKNVPNHTKVVEFHEQHVLS